MSDIELIEALKNGKGKMQEYDGRLNDGQMKARWSHTTIH
jgi:hypothetical protein